MKAYSREREGGLRSGRLIAWAFAFSIPAAVLLVGATRGSLTGDEAFYSGVALDSLDSSTLYPLTVDGRPYVAKPPLMIWLQALSMTWLGSTTLPARLPSVLFGLVTIAWILAGSAPRIGLLPAACAALLLVAAPTANGLRGAHGLCNGTGDALLSLTLLAAMLSLLRAGKKRPYAFGSCLGAAILSAWTKGLAGPAMLTVALPATALAAALSEPSETAPSATRRYWRTALAAVGAAWLSAALWIVSMWMAGAPRFFERVIERGVWQRILTGLDSSHVQDPSFYLGVQWSDFGAVLALALVTGWAAVGSRDAREGTPRAFMGAMVIAPLLWTTIASLSASKLPWYLLPLAAPLAIAIAAAPSATRAMRLGRAAEISILLLLVVVSGARAALATRDLLEHDGRHPLETALRELKARGEPVTVDTTLRFGRARDLDATEYFLARSLRHSSTGGPGSSGGCSAALAARPVSAREEPEPGAELLWSSAPRLNGRVVELVRFCPPSTARMFAGP